MADIITPISKIYDIFDSKVTDDMYMEMTQEETQREMDGLLEQAINFFEFPRTNLSNAIENVEIIREDGSTATQIGGFSVSLTREEANILATYMLVSWLTQQIAIVDNTRLKYTGVDFKLSSQANHLAKLNTLKKEYEREGFHLQRLYGRRRINDKGLIVSTMGDLMEASLGAKDDYAD